MSSTDSNTDEPERPNTEGPAASAIESRAAPATGPTSRERQRDESTEWQTVSRLWPYMWPHGRTDLKLRVLYALAALVIAKIITVLIPYTYKWAVDGLTVATENNSDLPSLPAWALAPLFLVFAYAIGRVAMVGFIQLRDGLFAKVSMHAVRELAFRTFQHLHRLSLRFHLERRTGGLSRVIERGIKGIENINRFVILNTIPTLLEFAFMIAIFAIEFDWRYVATLIATVVGYVWFTLTVSNWRIGIRRVMNESDTDANSKAVDSLLNYETVKYFGNEEMEARRFDQSMGRYQAATVRMWTSLSWLNFGQTVIFTLGMMTVMLMAAMGVQSGENTVGDFVLVNALMLQLYQPLNFIGFVYREIRQGLIDIEAMFRMISTKPEVEDRPGASTLEVEEGGIVFDDIHFHYNEDRPILKGMSFEVKPGQTVALVGPSGAGKSTISRLLFRFYEPSKGRLLIDGQDISDVTQKSLRQAIGMVPQDTVLFNDTIGYNIAYGRADASREDIEEAAKLAQIDEFVRGLPQGYDTEVGERGLKLSGGEKQRVAIARTILKSPPILMLDEATSALDSYTEREIQSALDQVSKDRTTLVIAHRLSTVVDADRIIVINAGQIVEEGTHDQLLSKDGLYAGMWHRQREADEARERFLAIRRDDDGYLAIGQKAADAN